MRTFNLVKPFSSILVEKCAETNKILFKCPMRAVFLIAFDQLENPTLQFNLRRVR
ncbi:hypothetical protein HNR39_004358 [Glaciimonas immobilis]|uniref:Uncharacterized protein n=1 Tax=Glaciimonas immobilis TaxID=728004 RepID=A0A840S1B3_9BURK|nr:hypothetical protein [Glaciimonas immobilis]